MEAASPRREQRDVVVLGAWLSFLAILLAGYAAVTLGSLGSTPLQDFVGRWVYDAVVFGAALSVVWKGLAASAERWGWLFLGAGLMLWTLGQTYYSVFLYYASPAPFPSPSDALFLAFYPASYLGLVLLMRARDAEPEPLAWVDGLIGALAVASVVAALVFPPVLDALGASPFGVAVSLAYPCADLVLLGLIVGVLSAARWRAQGTWLLICVSLLLFAASDVVYLSVGGQSTEALNVASIGWPLAFLLMATAAWLPVPAVSAGGRRGGRRRIRPAIALAALVVGLLAVGNFEPIGAVSVGLGVACLLSLLIRLGITFDQNAQMLQASRRDAVTDPLTGLGNRRKLLADLGMALSPGEGDGAVLALFDLDGFKSYNDSFGHLAGDDLLRRLGERLTGAVEPLGRGYRLGGDEFCVLAPTGSGDAETICRAAQSALTERGSGFSISASCGLVRLPAEAGTVTEAMRLADRRMYAQKGGQAESARSQTRGVLMGVLREREPEVGPELSNLSHLAADLGQALAFAGEELDVLVKAAELHDIGKVAIPEEILNKGEALNESEWELVARHPVIGERVLSAAPAMSEVASLVRSTHERWDGGGYPDGLAGDDIPLGSRIIFICDAFLAMTEGRPHSEPIPAGRALERLREGAGTQFDPELVGLFARLVEPGIAAVELRGRDPAQLQARLGELSRR